MISAKLIQECSNRSKPSLNEYTVRYGGVSDDEVWSGQLQKTYTSETKIRKSFQCYFNQSAKGGKTTKLHCHCVLCQDVIQLFAVTGEVFTVPLLFPVESVWPMDGGLLIERCVGTSNTTSSVVDQSSLEEGLPVMFSLLHPLDDISPIVCCYPSTGSSDQTILGYQCDPNLIAVYCSCDPSLLVCCDIITGRHSAWTIKPASDQDIPPVKSSISDTSGSVAPSILNLSTAGKFPSSPSIPYPLQLTPSEPQKGHPSSRRDSSHYHMAQRESPFGTPAVLLPTRQQPRASPHKPTPLPNNAQQVPGITPHTKSLSPVTLSPYAHTFPSFGSSWSTEEQSLNYLLLPNSCLKLVWEETNVPSSRTVTREHSTQVFFTEDMCGRRYLALLCPVDKQLRLLECTVKDEHNVQFGLTHDISASHAVPLKGLPLMVILSAGGQVLLYSGHLLVGEVHVDKCPSDDTATSIVSDCSRSHFTIVTSCNDQLHCSLPALPVHPLGEFCLYDYQYSTVAAVTYHIVGKFDEFVSRILAGLVQVLSITEACDALLHHYRYSHMTSYDQHWSAFQLWLTTMMGIKCYPVQHSKSSNDLSLWQKAIRSCDPALLRSIPAVSQSYKHPNYDECLQSLTVPTGPAILQSYRNVITYVMHLLYEDMKLNILYSAHLEKMATLLHHITSQLQWEQYVDHYCRDFPCLFTKQITNGHVPMDEDTSDVSHIAIATTPPHIMQWLLRKLEGKEVEKFPIISNFIDRLTTVIKLCGLYCWHASYPLALDELIAPLNDDGQTCSKEFQLACESYKNIQQEQTSYHARVILCLAQEGFTPKDLITLPVGISLLVQDCVTKCQHTPPTNWPVTAYDIIGREDIVKSLQPSSQDMAAGRMQAQSLDNDEDGMKMDCEVLNLRFSEDLRINEVRKLLRSTQSVRIALIQLPEVSDHEFIEQQETRLLAVCQRTMALPIGRGMLTFSTCRPVPTAALFIPNLILSGRAPPRNTTIGTDHIGAPANMEVWPMFHNIVSAGLTVMSGLPHLDSAWIGYNKVLGWESTSNWAGFLMAMGLQGYLSQLTPDRIYSITDKSNHELTTIGLILGLAAEKCGSMDPQVAQLLALHCQPLLPSGSAELDVTHSVQVAALAGTGLLYMGSAQRHLVEVMLKEIGSPPGPELEYAVDRESYSLAAGLSLGMITLGCGSDLPGMTDLDLVDQLYHYINGGIKKTSNNTGKTGTHLILEGDHVNTHVTTAGAIMGLALMFLKTNITSTASGLLTPDTLYQLEAIRPDFLLLRVLGHSLIMWDSVKPTTDWVQQHIPRLVQQYAFGKKSGSANAAQIDFETVSQAEVNIIAGCCVSLGFKFAGTNDPEAFKTLLHYNKYLLSRIESTVAVDQAGRSCLEGCLDASLLALAMVMSGSGNLEVMRLVKKLRIRITTPEVTYGSYMAIHMSLGLLFLGGGRYSLSTGNKAIAAMLCSFYPKFPSTSMDNRYHLQALRHLYVLAAERRVLVTVDSDSGRTCSVPVRVTTNHNELTAMSPCIVPSWEDITEIKIDGPRYWEFTLDVKASATVASSGVVFVKKRVGHLPYEDDKDGRCGSLSLAVLASGHHRAVHVDPTSVNQNTFHDPNLKNFWNTIIKETSSWNTFCSNVLTECAADEKLNVVPLYLQLEQLCHQSCLVSPTKMLDLWQFKLCQVLCSAESAAATTDGETVRSVMSLDYLHSVEMSLLSRIEAKGTDNEDELDQLLGHYIRGDQMKTLSLETAELLATALLLYNIPSRHIIRLDSNTTLPDLYLQLKSLGVSATAVTRLLPLLQL